MDAFPQLQLGHERTIFTFYGYRMIDGSEGRGYFKLANSLSEALADLHANSGVADEGGYLVRDAFLGKPDDSSGEPVIHVELVSMERLVAEFGDGDNQ